MRRLTSQVVLTAVGHAATMLAIVAGQFVLARSTSVQVFGAFAAAQALVALVEATIISRSGEVATQFLGQNWDRDPSLTKSMAHRLVRFDVLYCIGGYLGLVLLTPLLAHVLRINGSFVLALALAIPFQIGFGVRRSLYVIVGDIQGQALYEIMSATVLLVLSVAFTLLFGVWGMIGAAVLTAALKNMLVHWRTIGHWRQQREADRIVLRHETLQQMRAASLHSVMRTLLSNGTANADVILLSLLGRPEVVAIYRVAKTLSGIPARLAAPLWAVFRPRLLVALREDDHRRYVALVANVAGVFALASLVIIPVVVLAGPNVLELYGPQYKPAITPLLMLMFGNLIFGAITGWLSFTLIISSRKVFGSGIFVVHLALTLTLGLLFGVDSVLNMSIIVAASSTAMAGVAWAALILGRFRPRADDR